MWLVTLDYKNEATENAYFKVKYFYKKQIT